MTIIVSDRIKLAVKRAGREATLVRVGETVVGGEKVTVIAGPCSVESREQLLETARSVRSSGASMLRGGAFKPRTLPYSFQGLGVEAWSSSPRRGTRRVYPSSRRSWPRPTSRSWSPTPTSYR